MTTPQSEFIHVRIPADLKKEFIEYCEARAINMSALVRKLINDYLETHNHDD